MGRARKKCRQRKQQRKRTPKEVYGSGLWDDIVNFFSGNEGQCEVPGYCHKDEVPFNPPDYNALQGATYGPNPFIHQTLVDSGHTTGSDSQAAAFRNFLSEQPDLATHLKNQIIDVNGEVIRGVGSATRAVATQAEDVVRAAAIDTAKEVARTAIAAPATTFAVLAAKDPLGAANLAMTTVSVAVKAAAGVLKTGSAILSLGILLYKLLSPTERRKRRIAAYEREIDNGPIREYSERVANEAAEIGRRIVEALHRPDEIEDDAVFDLSAFCMMLIESFAAPASDLSATTIINNARDLCQRIDDNQDAKFFRVALLQILLYIPSDKNAKKGIDSVCDMVGIMDEKRRQEIWNGWKKRGYERALAFQNLVYKDVTKRTEYERSANKNSRLIAEIHERQKEGLRRMREGDDDDDDDDEEVDDEVDAALDRLRSRKRREPDLASLETALEENPFPTQLRSNKGGRSKRLEQQQMRGKRR